MGWMFMRAAPLKYVPHYTCAALYLAPDMGAIARHDGGVNEHAPSACAVRRIRRISGLATDGASRIALRRYLSSKVLRMIETCQVLARQGSCRVNGNAAAYWMIGPPRFVWHS